MKEEQLTKHEYTFSGLVHCGHCGCALVGEKKGKYVYYHWTGNKGKCPERYAREEVLEACFAGYSKGLCSMMKLWIGKEKGRRELFPATFVLVAEHTGQSSARQAKLGVSDWVQVPIE